MVFLVVKDSVGTVKLLKKKEAHHLVVKGHLRKGKARGSGSIYGWRKTIGSSNDECQRTHTGIHLPLKQLAKAYRGKFNAMLIKKNAYIGGLHLLENQLAFAHLHLFGCSLPQAFRGLKGDKLKMAIVAKPSHIVVDARLDIWHIGLADHNKVDIHKWRILASSGGRQRVSCNRGSGFAPKEV